MKILYKYCPVRKNCPFIKLSKDRKNTFYNIANIFIRKIKN